MRCGSCGRESPEGFKFCQSCGGILAAPIDLHDERLDTARQAVVRAIYDRTKTDKVLSTLWLVAIILVPIVTVVLTVVMVFWTMDYSYPYDSWPGYPIEILVVTNLMGFLTMILFAALFYNLVKRQNDHYAREASLRNSLASLIRAAAWSPGRVNDVTPETMALSMVEKRQEPHRNPWFWILVFFIPMIASLGLQIVMEDFYDTAVPGEQLSSSFLIAIVVFSLVTLIVFILEIYMLYFLTQSMIEHDSRWNLFAYNSRRALSKLGFPSGPPYSVSRLPERSTLLYIILTIFTGVFVLYWLYVILKDPNEHFRYQWEFEDNIMISITPPEYSTTSSASRL